LGSFQNQCLGAEKIFGRGLIMVDGCLQCLCRGFADADQNFKENKMKKKQSLKEAKEVEAEYYKAIAEIKSTGEIKIKKKQFLKEAKKWQ
jgi:predicted  nucleic acid-binding Zn-ribbon protein